MTTTLQRHHQLFNGFDEPHEESPISHGGAEWGDNHRDHIYLRRDRRLPAGMATVGWAGEHHRDNYLTSREETMPEHEVLPFIEGEVLHDSIYLDSITITLPA